MTGRIKASRNATNPRDIDIELSLNAEGVVPYHVNQQYRLR